MSANTTQSTDLGSNGTDTSVIITVAGCIGGLFLIVIIIFIAFVIYFYKKQMREEEYDKKTQSNLRPGVMNWNSHSLGQQFDTNINEIDEILWREGGRNVDVETANPAFGQDFEPLDVNNLKAFESATDDAVSMQETDSTSDMVEIKMDEEDDGTDGHDGEDSESLRKKQISILDMKTWGQPGSSRHNSMRRGFTSPFAHRPPSPDDSLSDRAYDRRSSFRSQDGSSFPFTVSQPSNDPRFEYTRTNPLMAEAVDRGMADRFSPSDRDYDDSKRDFGGSEDIESAEFDRSNTLRGSRRNQSVVDFYESGTRTTGSSFNLSLEGSGSVGKKRLWQNKQFSGLGGVHTN